MGIRQSEKLVVSKFTIDKDGNPTGGETFMYLTPQIDGGLPVLEVQWQNGIVGDDGQTGAFVEDVIETAVQRLVFFQESKFACDENELAIVHLHGALAALDKRTVTRVEQGVENTYEVHDS